MRIQFLAAVAVMLAGCSGPGFQADSTSSRAVTARNDAAPRAESIAARAPATVAGLPDTGSLVAYDRVRTPIRRGPYTWHPVRLSEEHALRAVVGADLVLAAPDGRPIRLRYSRRVEHEDGNWTWIGREPGARPGQEAILTFGPDAVFGTIPDDANPPLRVATTGRTAWLVETDPAALARLAPHRPPTPDFRLPPRAASAPGRDRAVAVAGTGTPALASGATAATTVDLLLGYTGGLVAALGGTSQTLTRLTNLVDITNQAYLNSEVAAQVRLVKAMQVDYQDTGSNENALYELTGVDCSGTSCSFVSPDPDLAPLHDAREQYGADLVSLVRDYVASEHEGCGIAWLNGGGEVPITADDAVAGFSVVSDGVDGDTYCRDEALAHELGHNMGSAHDRETADVDGDGVEKSEHGLHAYSFGYRTTPGNGDFYTIMAYPEARDMPPFQVSYRVFSNPAITSCGGRACGVANQADNARSLREAIPVVAGFRAAILPLSRAGFDFNGDGTSDVLWRHGTTGANTIWLSASKATQQAMARVSNLAWRMVGVGDVDADGRADVVWRNSSSGANTIWRSGNAATVRAMAGVASQAWEVVGVGDFNGDGAADVLWRNRSTGANTIWKSADKSNQQAMTTITNLAWRVVAVGDVNGDGRDDVIWRNAASGANSVWYSGNYATRKNLTAVSNPAWRVFGAGDFDGDGIDDLLWRNISSGANTIWRSADASTVKAMTGVANLAWRIEGVGDFDGNGVDDVLWRNQSTGANTIWREARAGSKLAMSTVAGQGWQIQP